ncbi:hypothetical protein OG252_07515 [Streptomyces sp. NBC_01352]|uniref:hypothetical protein n=1 Tax=Streptomyces sp. NBC_01352 TaxID=2903834 RepID=UPI002E32DEFA|nr:hypothetical protein [Streptomyces sp. NBC_01352]
MTQNNPAGTETRPTISVDQFNQLTETMYKAQLGVPASHELREDQRPRQPHRDLALRVLQTLGLSIRVDDPDEFKKALGLGPDGWL